MINNTTLERVIHRLEILNAALVQNLMHQIVAIRKNDIAQLNFLKSRQEDLQQKFAIETAKVKLELEESTDSELLEMIHSGKIPFIQVQNQT